MAGLQDALWRARMSALAQGMSPAVAHSAREPEPPVDPFEFNLNHRQDQMPDAGHLNEPLDPFEEWAAHPMTGDILIQRWDVAAQQSLTHEEWVKAYKQWRRVKRDILAENRDRREAAAQAGISERHRHEFDAYRDLPIPPAPQP